jgi:hypothetical protein
MSKKKNSIKGKYTKIRVHGTCNPFSSKAKATVNIGLTDAGWGYDSRTADVTFSIKEAKEIIVLIENAIKEANKKEKN